VRHSLKKCINVYPFGLQHKGYNNTITGREHDFDFLGQERQKELGLNWLTFRHRNYNPEIGRFFGVDPVAGDYVSISTYQFAHNNPISKVELEGLEGHQLYGVDVVNAPPSGRGSQNPAAHIPLPVGNQSTSSNSRSSSSGNTSASNDKNLRIAAAMMAQRTGGDADYYYNAMKDDNYVSNRVGDNIDAMTMFPIGLGGVFSNGVKRTIQNATKRIIGNKVDDIIEYSVKVAGDDIATSGTAKLSKSGVLELDFNVPDGMKGQGIGTEMFDDAIKTFGKEVKGVQGLWLEGDNLKAFNSAIEAGKSVKDAVFSTPTGKWAKKNGFNNIEWGANSNFNSDNTANAIQLIFR